MKIPTSLSDFPRPRCVCYNFPKQKPKHPVIPSQVWCFGYVPGVQIPNLRRCFQEAIWIRSPLQGQGLIESTPGAVQVSAVFVRQSSLWMVHDSDEVTHKLLNMRLF